MTITCWIIGSLKSCFFTEFKIKYSVLYHYLAACLSGFKNRTKRFGYSNLFGRVTEYEGLREKAKHYYQKVHTFYESSKARIEGEEVARINDDDIKEKLKDLGYL